VVGPVGISRHSVSESRAKNDDFWQWWLTWAGLVFEPWEWPSVA
jgi:hypothetical protein